MINSQRQIKEKKHRLDCPQYVGFKRAAFTVCVKGKKKLFVNKEIMDLFAEILRDVLIKNRVKNWVYVFMPDHVHLVLEGTDVRSDLLKTIKEFKQKTGVWLNKNSKCRWQKSSYDRIHRKNEDLYKSLLYIMNNPVRKGLVKYCAEYEGLGSLDFDIAQLIRTAERGTLV
ncbi:MAG TPA: hypothetical protein ENN43_02320 [bacterium]|nr:hypothetical protein [bacterium]